jgi:hypothetical protein
MRLHEARQSRGSARVFLEAIALGDDFFPARVFVEGQLLVSFGLVASAFPGFASASASGFASPSPSAADDSASAGSPS